MQGRALSLDMKKIKIFLLILLIVNLVPWQQVKADNLIAPTIINIDHSKLVTGLTPQNTEVLIYVDGLFQGMADINREGGITDNFSFLLQGDFSEGEHMVQTIAKNRTSLRLSGFSNVKYFNVESLPAPTLLKPNKNTITQKVKPLIIGLSKTNTKIKIFIDGVYNGSTGLVRHDSGTANFAYKPFLNLSEGWHIAWAVAEDENGRQSPVSNIIHFNIEKKFPAPTLLKTIINQNNLKRPIIAGLSKNDSRIRVFIDKKLDSEFQVDNHPSGTANFAYVPKTDLSMGNHIVYMTALDYRGKESLWSNIVTISIPGARQPMISEEAAFEEAEDLTQELNELIDIARSNVWQVLERQQKQDLQTILHDQDKFLLDAGDRELLLELLKNQDADLKARPDGIDQQASDNQITEEGKVEEDIAAGTGSESNNNEQKELEEILSRSTSTAEQTGLIDEDTARQNKIKLNLAIFFLFLIAVIAWIFWVNRELIKERQQSTDEENSNKSKK